MLPTTGNLFAFEARGPVSDPKIKVWVWCHCVKCVHVWVCTMCSCNIKQSWSLNIGVQLRFYCRSYLEPPPNIKFAVAPTLQVMLWSYLHSHTTIDLMVVIKGFALQDAKYWHASCDVEWGIRVHPLDCWDPASYNICKLSGQAWIWSKHHSQQQGCSHVYIKYIRTRGG